MEYKTKFVVRLHGDQALSEHIQKRFFAAGYRWQGHENQTVITTPVDRYGKDSSIAFGTDTKYMIFADYPYFTLHQLITIDEFFSEIAKLGPKVEHVQLNEHYQASVTADEIKVGQQTFSIDILQKLVDAHNNVK